MKFNHQISSRGAITLKIKLYWPKCNFLNNQWVNEKVDSYWVECTFNEAKKNVFPYLSNDQIEESRRNWKHREKGAKDEQFETDNLYYLVSKDLKSIISLPWYYPYSGQWNAYWPFEEIEEIEIKVLRDVSGVILKYQKRSDRMRRLSQQFIDDLKEGFLSAILIKVKTDQDLDLQIRENYINIYFKGNSLLKLIEVETHKYRVDIHEKFLEGLDMPYNFVNHDNIKKFMNLLPHIKENIIKYGSNTVEAEYEQLVIRANNSEERSNSDYYIVDRQYTTGKRDRFDLTGFYWDRKTRARGQEVPLCFIELKFSLNSDIKNVHEQIKRYYEYVRENVDALAKEVELLLHQKLELGLLKQPNDRLDAIKTLTISKNVDDYKYILLLVDFNPNSQLLDLDELRSLPFSKQITIFYSGLGLWESRAVKL